MLPPIDISYIAERLVELGDDIQHAFEESTDAVEPAPLVLLDGLDRFIETLRSADRGLPAAFPTNIQDATGSDPEILLEHGLRLLTQLAGIAERLELLRHAQAVEQLCLPLACWMLRRGAELQYPEPVVNAAAHLANSLEKPHQLAELFGLLDEVMQGIDLEQSPETQTSNTLRPWSVLLINRAIVATRSRRPQLMDKAFQAIAEHLPEAAPDFFREGMGQMESLDYPPQVREVMQRYFDIWCVGQRLH